VVLSSVTPSQVKDLFEFDLTPAVVDIDSARLINDLAVTTGAPKEIHLEIDTGMGRLGIRPDGLTPLLEALKGFKGLKLAGVYSHFAEMDAEDQAFSILQLKRFTGAVEAVKSSGFKPRYVHMANSAAVVGSVESHFNLVRPGIMLYGSYPASHFTSKIELKPVMRIETRVLSLKTLPPSSPISYSRTFITSRETLIAVLPIGYGDGLPRSLSGKGEALVRGIKVPMVGLVCMDFVMCDVTDVEGVSVGDPVVILGSQGAETITVEEMAARAGTISYEIFCNITARVPRIYE
jgi:alanine racemase